ncbi:MAG TPA: glycosyltransferase [Polyangiaceae bacterium]|nr:glycosyltransferase [Polyangiaceae bacterium]
MMLTEALIVGAGFWIWRQRLRRALVPRRPPPAPPSAGDGRRVLPVAVIVPARNEARNLPRLLDSLQRLDPAPAEIIVVDDHSNDGTGSLARALGARVVEAPPLPDGWLGKPWACHQGAAASDQPFLLFTDADTEHAPASLGWAFAGLERRRADLLSVIPSHRVVAAWERLQGVFQLLLLVATGADGRSALASVRRRARTGERQFCIGQYLLFRRELYTAIGGHQSVRARVAEDLAFCRAARSVGNGYALEWRPGMLRVRMYPEGFGAFVRGWRRNFREGLKAGGLAAGVELGVVIGWLLGAPIWLITGAASRDGATLAVGALAYLLAAVQVFGWQRRLGLLAPAGAVLYPLFTAVFVGVSLLAAYDELRRAPVTWRGRSRAVVRPGTLR